MFKTPERRSHTEEAPAPEWGSALVAEIKSVIAVQPKGRDISDEQIQNVLWQAKNQNMDASKDELKHMALQEITAQLQTKGKFKEKIGKFKNRIRGIWKASVNFMKHPIETLKGLDRVERKLKRIKKLHDKINLIIERKFTAAYQKTVRADVKKHPRLADKLSGHPELVDEVLESAQGTVERLETLQHTVTDVMHDLQAQQDIGEAETLIAQLDDTFASENTLIDEERSAKAETLVDPRMREAEEETLDIQPGEVEREAPTLIKNQQRAESNEFDETVLHIPNRENLNASEIQAWKEVQNRLGPDFEIKEVVGSGGFGVVFKMQLAGNEPIKRPSMTNPGSFNILEPNTDYIVKWNKVKGANHMQAMLREIRNTAMMNTVEETDSFAGLAHACIDVNLDRAEGEEYNFAMIMECIEGKDLNKKLEAGELHMTSALRHVADTAEALQHAHNKGLIHRDIKPDNIMVDNNGKVKIIDLGISDGEGLEAATEESLQQLDTQSRKIAEESGLGYKSFEGMLTGTPDYMAPEQIRMEAATSKTDVYSLGAVLYKLLTGTKTVQGGTTPHILMKVVDGEIDRNPMEKNKDVPPVLNSLIASMLDLEPANRPTMAEVQTQLNTILKKFPSTQKIRRAPKFDATAETLHNVGDDNIHDADTIAVDVMDTADTIAASETISDMDTIATDNTISEDKTIAEPAKPLKRPEERLAA